MWNWIRMMLLATAAVASLTACSAAPPADAVVVDDGAIEIVTDGMSFAPDVFVVPADEPVQVTLVNPDVVEHDLDVFDAETGAAFHLHVHPGETVEATMTLPAGDYEFICTVPGHLAAGMLGTVHVR
jgi:uncharacterized cupredoxin-like copper-binding protein